MLHADPTLDYAAHDAAQQTARMRATWRMRTQCSRSSTR